MLNSLLLYCNFQLLHLIILSATLSALKKRRSVSVFETTTSWKKEKFPVSWSKCKIGAHSHYLLILFFGNLPFYSMFFYEYPIQMSYNLLIGIPFRFIISYSYMFWFNCFHFDVVFRLRFFHSVCCRISFRFIHKTLVHTRCEWCSNIPFNDFVLQIKLKSTWIFHSKNTSKQFIQIRNRLCWPKWTNEMK